MLLNRLTPVGAIDAKFVSERSTTSFNKSIFIEDVRRSFEQKINYAGGRGTISSETIWTIVTMENITPALCDELKVASYDIDVLEYSDPERPYYFL